MGIDPRPAPHRSRGSIQAKFGIFIHWGLYSIPARINEWYIKHMYTSDVEWHTQHYGPPDKFGYKDFIPLFTVKNYRPRRVGATLQERRREVRCAGGRAPRRLRHVELRHHALVRREDGPEARPDRRTGRRCPEAGHDFRLLHAPHGAPHLRLPKGWPGQRPVSIRATRDSTGLRYPAT